MRGGGAITDITALKDLFEKADCNKWTLFRGFHKNMPHSQIIYKQNDDQMDLSDSWDELYYLINVHSQAGEGQFTIYVPAQSHNKGYTWWYQVGNAVSSGVAGIAGYNPAAVGMVPVAQVEQERRIWHLERQLEDMAAAQQAQQSVGQQILEKFMSECDMNQVVNAAIGLFNRAIPSAPGKAPITLQGTPADTAPQAETAGYHYHEEVIIPILDTIRPYFETTEDFYQFLNNVARLFASNPEGVKAMVNGSV